MGWKRTIRTDAAEIRIRAERRIGELMKAQKESGLMNRGGGDQKSDHRVSEKPSDSPITLSEAGIDKGLADRARKYAAVLNLFLQCYTQQEIADSVGMKQQRVDEVLPKIRKYEITVIPGIFTEDQPGGFGGRKDQAGDLAGEFAVSTRAGSDICETIEMVTNSNHFGDAIFYCLLPSAPVFTN